MNGDNNFHQTLVGAPVFHAEKIRRTFTGTDPRCHLSLVLVPGPGPRFPGQGPDCVQDGRRGSVFVQTIKFLLLISAQLGSIWLRLAKFGGIRHVATRICPNEIFQNYNRCVHMFKFR